MRTVLVPRALWCLPAALLLLAALVASVRLPRGPVRHGPPNAVERALFSVRHRGVR